MSGPLHRPYPPDQYRGTTGEVSARLRTGDPEPDVRYRSGVTCEYFATGDRTGTTFGLTADGTTPLAGTDGIYHLGGGSLTVGGTTAADRVIVANQPPIARAR